MLRLQGLGSNTLSGVPYTEEEINAWLERASTGGTFPMLVGYCRDGPQMSSVSPRLSARTTPPIGSGGCGDDEMADDEDGGEDEEDEEDGDS
uniref:Uncharacterized protein n=1 Tax=Tanacetum cinerariifolium TaxID=118510 RepID=A0A699QBF5_TANCI|nr:hypothetical protein [Tanacetum cinerariifolium]